MGKIGRSYPSRYYDRGRFESLLEPAASPASHKARLSITARVIALITSLALIAWALGRWRTLVWPLANR